MNLHLPTMASAAHSHSTYSAAQLFGAQAGLGAGNGLPNAALANQFAQAANNQAQATTNQPKGNQMTIRRVVQVFVADPNENISLDDCLLFKGEEKLTDATDQELFFELDIRELLEKHNEKRVKIVDKKVKDRTEYLEPAKVRDLKMVVVTVANL